MHEMSLLENVREILEAHAKSQQFKQVKQVTLEIGKLACIEVDAIRFGFDVVMKDSVAEQAELEITELDGLGICQTCRKQVSIATLYEPCPECGSPRVEVIQGTEMKVKNLVVI